MRFLAIPLFSVALAGCVTHEREESIRVAPVHVTVDTTVLIDGTASSGSSASTYIVDRMVGEKSLVGEIWIGCVGHFAVANRWPVSLQEVNGVFADSGLHPQFLPLLTRIEFSPMDDGGLVVEFDSDGSGSGRAVIHVQKQEGAEPGATDNPDHRTLKTEKPSSTEPTQPGV